MSTLTTTEAMKPETIKDLKAAIDAGDIVLMGSPSRPVLVTEWEDVDNGATTRFTSNGEFAIGTSSYWACEYAAIIIRVG